MEAIGNLRKLFDLAEGKDHVHLSPRDLPLNKSFVVGQGPGNNLCTFFTEASLKQCTYFEDSQLQHLGVHLLLLLLTLLIQRLIWLFERTFRQSLDDVDNFLDWVNNDELDVISKCQGSNCQNNTSEDGCIELQ